MAHPEPLPDAASLNEEGHVEDHNQIVDAVRSIDERLHDVEVAPPGGVSDHGALTGLVDDDHPQYLTQARGDARYYTEAEVDAALGGKASTASVTAATQRGNHTGTQTASTISDFNTAVRTNRLDQMAAPTAPVAFGSQRITGLGTPSASTDAATKGYVDSAVGAPAAGTRYAVDYGVVPDAYSIAISFNSGSTTISAMSGLTGWPTTFSAGDVGKAIWIYNGSSAGNKWHYTTISSVAGGGATAVVASAPNLTSAYSYASVGTNNTAALNAFFAAAQDYENLVLPEGEMLTEGGHTLAAFANIQGSGRWASRLVTAHNSHVITRTKSLGAATEFAVIHAASGSVDLGISASGVGWPTDGSALRVTAPIWDGGYTERCVFIGTYRGVLLETGVHYVRDNIMLNHQRAAVECWNPGWPDYGHITITGNSITSRGPGSTSWVPSCDNAIHWRGSGGLMVSNNSIGGGQNMIRLRNDGATGATGNVVISSNSLEDWAQEANTGHAIYIDQWNSEAGYLTYISITGNVFQTNANSNAAIRMVASSDSTPDGLGNYGIRAVSVTGNAGKFTGFLVDATRVRDLSVTGNTVVGVVPASQVTQTSCTNVTIA